MERKNACVVVRRELQRIFISLERRWKEIDGTQNILYLNHGDLRLGLCIGSAVLFQQEQHFRRFIVTEDGKGVISPEPLPSNCRLDIRITTLPNAALSDC